MTELEELRQGGPAGSVATIRRNVEAGFRQIVRDDRYGDETWLRAASRCAGPRTTNFPVVIGAESHPFPFRTRKLRLPPPMVLHAQVCGRVGRCRGLLLSRRNCQASKVRREPASLKGAGFCRVRPRVLFHWGPLEGRIFATATSAPVIIGFVAAEVRIGHRTSA